MATGWPVRVRGSAPSRRGRSWRHWSGWGHRLLERVRGGVIAERIAAAVFGTVWSLATLLVIPIIAIDGVGPIRDASPLGRG